MAEQQLSGHFALYQGHCLELQSWNDQGQVLLATTSPALAGVLGLSSTGAGPYRAWLPRSEVKEVYWQGVYGETRGVRVLLVSEEGTRYFVRAQTPFDGFTRMDKHLWEGFLDKSAITRTWTEKKPVALP